MHWREKELFNILKNGKSTTSDIVSRAHMSKVTALKYLELLKESWIKVINMGAATIYPSHGNPFPVEEITKYLN